jgi:hypothetical protein
MSTGAALQSINLLLAAIQLARAVGVNYREIIDAQEAAEAAGTAVSQETIQKFLDQSQAAIGEL